MAEHGPDCLVKRFDRFKQLSSQERAFLRDLQKDEQVIDRGTQIIVQGHRSTDLFVLKSGWAYSHKVLRNGKRQILEILLPGDMLGMREFAFEAALNSVTTLTTVTVCPFPRSRLADFYRDHSGLTGVLCDILMREQAILIERLADIGSRTAYQRVAHLLMELYTRVERIGLRRAKSFVLPMNQALIGEALGLSRVHVARTIRDLRLAGLLEMERSLVTILDEKGLTEAADFGEPHLSHG